MTFNPDFPQMSSGNKMAALSSFVVLASGFAVLCGWQFDIEELKGLSSALIAMNPLSAVCFICSALALACYVQNKKKFTSAAEVLSFVVLTLSVIKLVSFFGADFGMDQWLFPEKLDISRLGIPNRMAPNTAIGFFFLGASLVFLNSHLLISQICTMLSLMISLLALIGYAYGVSPFTQVSYFIPMALNTAILFCLISVGTMSARYRQGFMHFITESDAGGLLLRRLLWAVILVPIFLGWLAIKGEDLKLYGGRYTVALVVISSVIIITIVMFWNARNLSHSSRELGVLNRELEAFSYSVSHDLRAPLRRIGSFAEIILETEGKNLSPEGQQLFQRMLGGTVKMSQLIDGMLSMSRLTKKQLAKTDVSLTSLANEIVTQLRDTYPARQSEIQIAEGLSAHCDPKLIEIILQNLIGNAWKYSAKKPKARIEFGQLQINGQKTFYIRDNGVGFDMKYIDRLFGTFQRLHSETEFEGTGIGLATVQRIIKKHGGTIWAKASKDEGATFYFTL